MSGDLSSSISNNSNIKKRVVRLPEILDSIDSNKRIFPKGVLSTLSKCEERSPIVKRVEVFGESERNTFGIIRTLFVAYSSEKSLLEMAESSNCVIQVNSLNTEATQKNDSQMIEDKLLLRRASQSSIEHEVISFTVKLEAPKLMVPEHWLDKFRLRLGDRIMVSNPLENYFVPPPSVQ